MRKLTITLIAILVIFSLVMGACSSSSSTTSKTTPASTVQTVVATSKTANPDNWPKEISISGSGGSGTAGYILSGGLGVLIQKYMNVSTKVVSTMGFNVIPMMQKNDVLIATVGTTSVGMSLMGTGPAKDTGPAPMRAFIGYMGVTNEVVVLDKSGIKTYKDLEGKTVAVGPKNIPWTADLFQSMLKANGVDATKVKVQMFDTEGEALDGLKTGVFDAVLEMAPVSEPAPSLTDLFTSFPGHFLEYTDLAKTIEMAPPGMGFPLTIPAKSYKGQTADHKSFGGASFYVVHANLPDDLVYALTAMSFQHQSEWTQIQASAAEFRVEHAPLIATVCPFHPGAIKYYKEKGIWTADMDKQQADWLAKLPK